MATDRRPSPQRPSRNPARTVRDAAALPHDGGRYARSVAERKAEQRRREAAGLIRLEVVADEVRLIHALELAGLLPTMVDHDKAAIEHATERLLELVTADCHV